MLLEIDNLRLSLGGVPILRDVKLSLAGGEIYGLLGPNGAGKSTTIGAAIGLLKAESGTIRVLGKNPVSDADAIHGRLGVLPEQNGFYDWMAAEEYLSFFGSLYCHRLDAVELRRRLEQVGLSPRPGQAIGTFSRGMRQRLGLARALIADPALLILDEPTNGLDPRGRRDIHDILLGLAESGVGILLCTHLLDDVDRLCKRIGIIVEGRTIVEGAIADLVGAHHQLARFRLRLVGDPPSAKDNIDCVAVVAREGEWWIVDLDPRTSPESAWRDLLFRGWPVAEIHRDSGGLEDLYMSLTEKRAA